MKFKIMTVIKVYRRICRKEELSFTCCIQSEL